jgi:hypothetical protein
MVCSIAEIAPMDEWHLRKWQPIASAPFDRDLELSVIEADETHALVFPCRRTEKGWLNVTMNLRISVDPTHWRLWCHRRGCAKSDMPQRF